MRPNIFLSTYFVLAAASVNAMPTSEDNVLETQPALSARYRPEKISDADKKILQQQLDELETEFDKTDNQKTVLIERFSAVHCRLQPKEDGKPVLNYEELQEQRPIAYHLKEDVENLIEKASENAKKATKIDISGRNTKAQEISAAYAKITSVLQPIAKKIPELQGELEKVLKNLENPNVVNMRPFEDTKKTRAARAKANKADAVKKALKESPGKPALKQQSDKNIERTAQPGAAPEVDNLSEEEHEKFIADKKEAANIDFEESLKEPISPQKKRIDFSRSTKKTDGPASHSTSKN